ncbi:hypothetical protein D3C72_2371210 [compost metagenome]
MAIARHGNIGGGGRGLREIMEGQMRIVEQQIGVVIDNRPYGPQAAFDFIRHAKAARRDGDQVTGCR